MAISCSNMNEIHFGEDLHEGDSCQKQQRILWCEHFDSIAHDSGWFDAVTCYPGDFVYVLALDRQPDHL